MKPTLTQYKMSNKHFPEGFLLQLCLLQSGPCTHTRTLVTSLFRPTASHFYYEVFLCLSSSCRPCSFNQEEPMKDLSLKLHALNVPEGLQHSWLVLSPFGTKAGQRSVKETQRCRRSQTNVSQSSVFRSALPFLLNEAFLWSFQWLPLLVEQLKNNMSSCVTEGAADVSVFLTRGFGQRPFAWCVHSRRHWPPSSCNTHTHTHTPTPVDVQTLLSAVTGSKKHGLNSGDFAESVESPILFYAERNHSKTTAVQPVWLSGQNQLRSITNCYILFFNCTFRNCTALLPAHT